MLGLCGLFLWKVSRLLGLVHVFLAFSCTTVALDLYVFNWKLVVVGQLLPRENLSQSKDDYVFLAQNVYDFAVAIWLKKSLINFFCNEET